MTQNNLGNALQEQGTRTGGEAGQRLLAEAVAAYRAALEVYTRAQLPQQWATTQNNLGTALQEQGTRTGGEAGQRLLAEAVAAYRAALEVFSLEHTAPYWVQTTRNLTATLLHLGDLPGLAAAIEDLLRAEPDNVKLYIVALSIYHEILFDFPAAERVSKVWVERHAYDLSARSKLAEALLTVGRLEEAVAALEGLLSQQSNGETPVEGVLDPDTELALRLLEIIANSGLGAKAALAGARNEAHTLLLGQPDSFAVGWSFQGTRHFVATDPAFEAERDQLLALLDAAGKDRDTLLSALHGIAVEPIADE
ncbi:tetratricopeptide repeat protein [Marichromatium purpuratum]|nr:tetratricopeptide repeat protein [Marichromatium purpuratum]